jgi:putative endonuclease
MFNLRIANLVGLNGEKLVEQFYRNNKYRVIHRNLIIKSAGVGRECEIDLIVLKGDEIVFVEVKTSSVSFENALYAVDINKQSRMRRASQLFMIQRPEYSNHKIRFDVATVYKKEVRVIEYAF